MNVIRYEHVNETVYHEKLDNGLDVYVLPKKGFQKTFATFSTKYGSIDNHFQVEGKQDVQVPDGIAHFLEHKMFEEPTGDIFATFASYGASANAFTSFDRTVYLFSATDHVMESLETLLNFVQNPYFTNENVEKEKGIIGQEINMYKDHPDWRSYFGLIEAMYSAHPVRIDIAGTIESISQITKEMLYECYHTFYHPTNMSVFVVGGVDAEEVIDRVRRNQAAKSFEPQGEIKRIFQPEPDSVHNPKKVTKLPVSQPKCLFGFKEAHHPIEGRALLEKECASKLMMDILFSPTSAIYQTLYDEKLISDNFGADFNCTPGYTFSVIGGDTRDPELLLERIRQLVNDALERGIGEKDFERSRNKKIGGFLRMLNSPESIARLYTDYRFKGADAFDMLTIYRNMSLEEVNKRLHEHFNWEQLAVSIVADPKEAS